MKLTLTTAQAVNILLEDEYARWSYRGATALCEHLQEMETFWGDEIEFDAVAIRSDWKEHDSLEDWAMGCGFNPEASTEDEREEEIRVYIQDYGQLIEFNGGVIVSRF